MIRAAVLIAATVLAAGPLFAALNPRQRQLNIDSFEYVWKPGPPLNAAIDWIEHRR
ncbi:MAG TPA: hypothetical protein VMH80_04210 [Bryobacteraceae bacterium]|nr:hypothetical protein [Bryobacteraceae bacterium]